MEAYPPPPSACFYDVPAFGVGQRSEEFLPLTPKSVSLPQVRSLQTVDYGQLRQEPAITVLDWLFTPIPRSQEHMHVAPLRASTKFYLRFALPRNSSNGFG
jgi:hypothetical protein